MPAGWENRNVALLAAFAKQQQEDLGKYSCSRLQKDYKNCCGIASSIVSVVDVCVLVKLQQVKSHHVLAYFTIMDVVKELAE